MPPRDEEITVHRGSTKANYRRAEQAGAMVGIAPRLRGGAQVDAYQLPIADSATVHDRPVTIRCRSLRGARGADRHVALRFIERSGASRDRRSRRLDPRGFDRCDRRGSDRRDRRRAGTHR